jgi:alpha-mannosidase/mannosylglycerate hydrolase
LDTKTLHIISHTHWDREWYMSFEKHRHKLVRVLDSLIELMERDPGYKYFHLDGQYIVIEDYLAVRPEMRERLFKLIADDRIQVGPLYILQDEYLTSGEANVRNVLYGLSLCKQNGILPVMTGYFPDAFGNISQMPQILAGFRIGSAVFGRGINATGANNSIVKEDGIENSRIENSEFIWRSPDGSEVMAVMFSNWYHNAMQLPEDDAELKNRLAAIIESCGKYARTPELLGMNGCDHQPIQKNLSAVLKKTSELAGIRVVHSNFKDYLKKLAPYRDEFKTFTGELESQLTEGYTTLIGTASTHVQVKQLNFACQNLLEKFVEPVSALCFLEGGKYDGGYIRFAWKALMENHPHDSICCCSDDEVASDMERRLAHVRDISGELFADSVKALAARVAPVADAKGIFVYNAQPRFVSEVVTAQADFDADADTEGLSLFDSRGDVVPMEMTEERDVFTYELPEETFRVRKTVKRLTITFKPDAAGLGYKTYYLKKAGNVPPPQPQLQHGHMRIENDKIQVSFCRDGSFFVTEKATGFRQGPFNVYEDTGDIGDSYNYRRSSDKVSVISLDGAAEVAVFKILPFAVTYRVKQALNVPKCRDGSNRSAARVPLEIESFVTVTADSPRVDIRCKLNNTAKDHRLRALFFNGIEAEFAYADGQFDILKRPITPWAGWKNPENPHRCQAFAELCEPQGGIIAGGKGLHEYEILRDGKNTLALTLLRAVGEIGDWGYFPTPNMQLQRQLEFAYCVALYGQGGREEAERKVIDFGTGAMYAFGFDGKGGLPAEKTYISCAGGDIRFSALKKCETSDALILRGYNPFCEARTAKFVFSSEITGVFDSALNEEKGKELPLKNGILSLEAPAKKIVTLYLEKA